MAVKTEDGTDFLIESAEKQGIACATVKDGHVLVFTKSHLEMLLKAVNDKGSDKCVVFVKRLDFAN